MQHTAGSHSLSRTFLMATSVLVKGLDFDMETNHGPLLQTAILEQTSDETDRNTLCTSAEHIQ